MTGNKGSVGIRFNFEERARPAYFFLSSSHNSCCCNFTKSSLNFTKASLEIICKQRRQIYQNIFINPPSKYFWTKLILFIKCSNYINLFLLRWPAGPAFCKHFGHFNSLGICAALNLIVWSFAKVRPTREILVAKCFFIDSEHCAIETSRCVQCPSNIYVKLMLLQCCSFWTGKMGTH